MLKHQNITFIYRIMNILNFFEFILEKIEEKTFPFFFSSSFSEKLQRIDSPISDSLLGMKYEPFKYSMINIGSQEDTITIVPSNKMIDAFSGYDPEKWNKILRNIRQDDELWRLNSVEMKIGRFVKRAFDNFKDSEIEDFVNKWKSLNDQNRFELWSRDSISDAYVSEKYSMGGKTSNPLINSCMNDMRSLIQFYEYSSAEILVLLDENDGIMGRSLVWTDHQNRKIMDRVYYIYDSDYHRFTQYAKDNGWYYKTKNMSGGSSFMKDGKEVSLKTRVKVPNVFDMMNDNEFPYMDTFCYAQGVWAMNYEPDTGKYFKLTDTEGGYEEYNNLTDIHGNEIYDSSDFVESIEQRGYIDVDSAVNVSYGDVSYPGYRCNDWFEESYVEDPKNGFVKSKGKWYKEKHCVWSDREKNWIFRPDAIYNNGDWIHWDDFNPGGNNI